MTSGNAGIALSFTEIRVVDWPRTVRWYVDILGLRLVLEDVERRFALLEAGGGRIALKGCDAPGNGPGGLRLVFQVVDLETERTRLLAKGVAVTPVAEDLREGYREVRLRAPDGTPLTLFCWPDPERE